MERLTTLEKVILRLEHWNEMNKTKFVMQIARPVFELLLEDLKKAKAEQPKVIRCKDCKFAYRKETNLSNSYECRYPFSIIKENHYGDFFCAFAEPKDG